MEYRVPDVDSADAWSLSVLKFCFSPCRIWMSWSYKLSSELDESLCHTEPPSVAVLSGIIACKSCMVHLVGKVGLKCKILVLCRFIVKLPNHINDVWSQLVSEQPMHRMSLRASKASVEVKGRAKEFFILPCQALCLWSWVLLTSALGRPNSAGSCGHHCHLGWWSWCWTENWHQKDSKADSGRWWFRRLRLPDS